MPERPLRCSCCNSAEPAGGWHSYAVADGKVDEVYCSENCFIAHQDASCGCFAEDEFSADDDEDWL